MLHMCLTKLCQKGVIKPPQSPPHQFARFVWKLVTILDIISTNGKILTFKVYLLLLKSV